MRTNRPRSSPFFVDPWDRPILYYRANKAATLMCGSDAEAEPGVYRQEDNAIITGSDSGQLGKAGIDFGAGELSANVFHGISRVAYPVGGGTGHGLAQSDSDRECVRLYVCPVHF